MSGLIWEGIEQQSEEWHKVRIGRPTASHFDRILTAEGKVSSAWEAYACELIAETINPRQIPELALVPDADAGGWIDAEPIVGFTGNRHTERGNLLEPEARRAAAQILDVEIEEVGFVTRPDLVIGCSPDGLIRTRSGRYSAGIEIKCPELKHHVAYTVAGKVPTQYRQQVHGSMAVTGLRSWYFISYARGVEPFLIREDWTSYTDQMAEALDRFVIYYAEMRKRWVGPLIGKGPKTTPREEALI
jgi:hypothetical protein